MPNVAPGYTAPANGPLATGDLVGVNAEPFVGIALDDAIGMALGRNTDLAIAQSNQRIANYQIIAAKDSVLDVIRVACYVHQISEAMEMVEHCTALGYEPV